MWTTKEILFLAKKHSTTGFKMMDVVDQLALASSKKKKKKIVFNDGMVDASDRGARRKVDPTTGMIVVAVYCVIIFGCAILTRNYLVALLVPGVFIL